MIHYIYCYTNKINNKEYIGQTNNLNRRKKQHIQDSIHLYKGHENAYNQPIHQAIRKYGINNFNINVLEIINTDDWSKVNERESYWIKYKNTLSPNGYNLSRSYISDINNGRCLRSKDENYPLQQNRITEDEYYEIFDLLENTNYSINQIAIYLNRNKDTIQKINKGHQKIVRALYDGDFPIRKNARQGYILKPVETISGETESKVIIDT